MWRQILVASAVAMLASVASGGQKFSQAGLQRLLKNKVESVEDIASNKLVIQAVRVHNARDLSLEEIQKIDREWMSTKELTPFKKSLQENEVGSYFKSMIDFNQPIYSEAFLTGRRGANLAAYPATTDYWQGDEQKWIEAFDNGSGKVFIGSVEFDESTQSDAIQISVPVMDDGKAIGVLIVGVKLTYLQAQYLKPE